MKVAFLAAAWLASFAPAIAGEDAANRLLIAQTELAISLLNGLAESKADNILLSPSTLGAALGVAALGASDAGRAAIAASLGFGQDAQGPIRILDAAPGGEALKTAAAIVFDDGLRLQDTATALLAEHRLQPDIQPLSSPATVGKINAWVADATSGAIQTILDAPPGGDFVSLGALSFKARWKTEFQKDSQSAPFLKAGGSEISVPMMRLSGTTQRFRIDERFAAVDLAYADEAYRMVVVAARSGKGLTATETGDLAPWLRAEGFADAPGDVQMPRFAMTDGRDLLPHLERLGLATLRSQKHVFSGFTEASVQLAAVVQKVMVSVDETGTQAAAATAVTTERSIDTKLVRVTANGRFLFALRDVRSGLLLAVGLIGDPLSSGR
ncbi:serpin family protein [Neorhizobium galegae]|nr:serpin family protein [Neorhizobium galegae]CDZ56631.1 SPI-1 serine protease inhibitor-like protein [Neorhizobium galegae bv. orientalis]KAB1122712.1 serpin family protein [Neorhizobium galegae]MCQ1570306.1 serpin family protein [Neorhizobium galegae]MCQ1807853.1 serpin family protein [Neorhizobium galegae]CDZ64303.1 SPI-1 serine protease inhibitor-like protein [Neorhizobium galegae bv. orientalis]